LVNSGRVDGIELNASKGSWGDGIEFLADDVPHLQHLILINLLERSVEPLQALRELRTLTLSAYATSRLDFANFPALTAAFIEWRKQYGGLDSCTNLEQLYVNKYRDVDLIALQRLNKLSALTIGDSRTFSSLDGVSGLSELRSLGLRALPQLSDLTPVKDLASTLEDLDLKQCRRLATLEPIGSLARLRRLILENCGRVPSLRPLADLASLEELFFYGDTYVVDGDLDFLRTLRLRAVSFQNRRHYSLRREELPGFAA
jgi:hypothetical protein